MVHFRVILVAFLAFLTTVIVQVPEGVAATSVTVDAGGYDGQWRIKDVSGVQVFPVSGTYHQGDATATLEPGTYTVQIGLIGNFAISLDSLGQVSVPGASAQGGAGTLSFNTDAVDMNPDGFVGGWGILSVRHTNLGNGGPGPDVVTLVRDIRYFFYVGSLAGFYVTVDGAGVVSVDNNLSGTGGHASLTFANRTVAVDPGTFDGLWKIYGVSEFVAGPATLVLVPGTKFLAGAGSFAQIGFQIDANDNFVSNGVSLTGGPVAGGTLQMTFNTEAIQVDPQMFGGNWVMSRVGGVETGPVTVHLVPGNPALRYQMYVGGGNRANFYFDIGAGGAVTVFEDPQALGAPATGDVGLLTFNNTVITVEPSDPSQMWSIVGLGDPYDPATKIALATGSADAILVPGVKYALSRELVGETYTFGVATEPCSVNPASITFTNAVELSLSCGSLDDDNDGVANLDDNCPTITNAGQLDQDSDGLGNVCDADLDGDLIDNISDNCADIENPYQEDFDGDGQGDACEDDTDGDVVADIDDNCPLDINTDQADNDGDGMGDICDDDDDNDSHIDLADNCPSLSNPLQTDFDVDGVGDVCDGDDDGDDVADDIDLCSGTPDGAVTNADGCNGTQFVAAQCEQEDFVQHGQYVSCVANAANAAVDQGLLAPKVKARFITKAARSK